MTVKLNSSTKFYFAFIVALLLQATYCLEQHISNEYGTEKLSATESEGKQQEETLVDDSKGREIQIDGTSWIFQKAPLNLLKKQRKKGKRRRPKPTRKYRPTRSKKTPCTKHKHRKTTPRPTTPGKIYHRTRPRTVRTTPMITMATTTACKPKDCKVGGWGEWSACSSACGDTGLQSRKRKVTETPSCGGKCSHRLVKSRPCNRFCKNGGTPQGDQCKCQQGFLGKCCEEVLEKMWSPWGAWSECSVTCGDGFMKRARNCVFKDSAVSVRSCKDHAHICDTARASAQGCEGVSQMTQRCSQRVCPVDGKWGEWGKWSTCTSTCGGGQRFRIRQCNNPSPSNGGKKCTGLDLEAEVCSPSPCPTAVDGAWSEWSLWSICTKACGTGKHVRMRKCNSPVPAHGGRQCQGYREEAQLCNTRRCFLGGNGGSGGNKRVFLKDFINELAQQRLRMRRDDVTTEDFYHADVDITSNSTPDSSGEPPASWGQWTHWSSCSVSCGGGQRFRIRFCSDPAVQCQGESMQTQGCSDSACSVKGKRASFDWRS